jgi:hypothetical protein
MNKHKTKILELIGKYENEDIALNEKFNHFAKSKEFAGHEQLVL